MIAERFVKFCFGNYCLKGFCETHKSIRMCLIFDNSFKLESYLLCVDIRFLVKLVRAIGGCLGTERR